MGAIVQLGEDVLKSRTHKVTNFRDPWVRSFLERMEREMDEHDGMGLAANQLGVRRRMFVAHLGENKTVIRFVNPEIVGQSMQQGTAEEGCLSIPGEAFLVSRPTWVLLRWQDERGKVERRQFGGWDARCVHHELLHLNGITVADIGVHITNEEMRKA